MSTSIKERHGIAMSLGVARKSDINKTVVHLAKFHDAAKANFVPTTMYPRHCVDLRVKGSPLKVFIVS